MPRDADATKAVIASCVDEWLLLARVRPVLHWHRGDTATMTLGDGRLFGALGLALAMHAARTDGLAICSACGIAYSPSRRPRAGERRYCRSKACQLAKGRDAQRDKRQRDRGGPNDFRSG